MHTVFSDGSASPEEMIERGIALGLEEIGISDHSYTFFDTSYCMQEAEEEEYRKELDRLKKKYEGKIRVLKGIEQDFWSAPPSGDYEYIIGSVHFLRTGDIYFPVDESAEVLRDAAEKYFGGDMMSLCELYYETVVNVAEKTGADIVGHFDLISKFNEKGELFDPEDPRYVKAWKKAADRLLPAGIPFEINTGAISRGYRTSPYPSPEQIGYIKSRGGRLILSSDAHSPEYIAYLFGRYEELLW